MRGVDVDDIETGIQRPDSSGHVVILQALNLRVVGVSRIVTRPQVRRQLGNPVRNNPCFGRHWMGPAMPELDSGQRAILMDPLTHHREIAYVVIVPEPRGNGRGVVGFRVDRTVFGANGSPAALGFDGAVLGLETGPLRASPSAMRYLEEPVAQHLWPDGHRLEENVIPAVTPRVPPLV